MSMLRLGTARYLVNRQRSRENVDGKILSETNNGNGRPSLSLSKLAPFVLFKAEP